MKIRIFCFVLLWSTVFAYGEIMIKGNVDLKDTAKLGETYSREIVIENKGRYLADVLITLRDYTGSRMLDPGTLERSSAPWIKFNSNRVMLDPGGEFNLKMTVSVPAAAELSGSYWSLVCIEEIGAYRTVQGLGVKVRSRTAILQLVDIDIDLVADIEVKNQKVEGAILSFELHNVGSKFLKAAVSLEIGGERLNVENSSLYPGFFKSYKIPLTVAPGNYNALLIVDGGGSDLWASRLEFGFRAAGGLSSPKAF